MRIPLLAVLTTGALASLLATSPAQSQSNKFEIYPDIAGTSSSYVSRFNLNGQAGELLQEVPAALFKGNGDNGSACQATAFDFWTADENAATQETYQVVLRLPQSGGGGPDTSPAGVIFQSGNLMTPVGTGRLGWNITVTFATPVTLPCEGGFYMGVYLNAAPTWSMDGQSLWSAFYPNFLTATVGDDPRVGAPNHCWYVMNGLAARSMWSSTVRVSVRTNAAVLNMGGIDPSNTRQSPQGSSNYGAGGLYPDISGQPRADGLDARVLDNSNSGGRAFLLLSPGFFPVGGIALGGVSGRLWIHPAGMVQFGSAPISAGLATIPLVSPGGVPAYLQGFFIQCQALTVDASLGNLRLTNSCGISF